MKPGPHWHQASCASQGDHDEDKFASNAALRFDSGTPMSSSVVATKLFDDPPEKPKLYPSRPAGSSRGAKSSLTPNDFRSRTRRVLRAPSHFRVYHDHRRTHSSPVYPIPSPRPKDLTLPPFPPPISATTPEPKFHPHERPSWTPAPFGLSESPAFWLVLYFLCNLALTLYNKSALIRFPFPYTLTALHALCSTAGSSVVLRTNAASPQGSSRSPSLSWKEVVTLVSFSTLFTINIAVSNASLHLVTIPFHQVVRATTPLFTMLLSQTLLGTRSSREKLTSLLPVVAGVAFATYGDYYFSPLGFMLTFLGTVLAALKTIATNVLQTPATFDDYSRLSTPLRLFHRYLHPQPTLSTWSSLEYLHFLSPLAFVQSLALAYLTGELGTMYHHTLHHLNYTQQLYLLANGVLAFGLNIASFGANKRLGAVTMSVAANVKQVLTVLFAVILFDLRISPTNAIGIALTLAGGGWYTTVDLREKKRKKFMQESLSSDINLQRPEDSP